MFSHEKLSVYQDAVCIQRSVIGLTLSWDSREAVVDQILRATESIPLNIAAGTSLRSGNAKVRRLSLCAGIRARMGIGGRFDKDYDKVDDEV
jgi:hypothetical protein